jgi:outer membrane protein
LTAVSGKASLVRAALVLLAALTAHAQPLTLEQAERTALSRHPRLQAARFSADALRFQPAQIKSIQQPQLVANVTGSVADHLSRIGAGGLNASSVFSRFGSGIAISQLVYDFGRTRALAQSAGLRADAQSQTASAVANEIRLQVRRSYYQVLLAQASLRTMDATVAARRLVLKQITALAEAKLRSTLDVSFAELALSEAELALSVAESQQRAALVDLAAAMGIDEQQNYQLADVPMPAPLGDDVAGLVTSSRLRPDLEARRLTVQAARSFAESERRLKLPTVTGLGVGGFIPAGDPRLRTRYGSAGINFSLPILNGHLNESRRLEAETRVKVVESEMRDAEVQITTELRKAFLQAKDAERRLPVIRKMVEQADRTLRLAQTRYDLGLGSVIELNQAQLSKTSAEIAELTARYEYQIRRAELDFLAGR